MGFFIFFGISCAGKERGSKRLQALSYVRHLPIPAAGGDGHGEGCHCSIVPGGM